MIAFEDGPAAGEVLRLRAAPFLLRVVKERKGQFDALDQPDDEPDEGDAIFAYVRQGEPFRGMIDYSTGRGRKGEPFINAEYRLHQAQPTDEEARDRDLWAAWCALQPIGPERAAKLEQHLKTVIGLPNPLRFVNNWCRWSVSSLAELTEEQGKELIEKATEQMAIASRQVAAEQERDRRKALAAEGVYRG